MWKTLRTAARVEEWNSQQVQPKVRLCNGQKNSSFKELTGDKRSLKRTQQHKLDLQSCI